MTFQFKPTHSNNSLDLALQAKAQIEYIESSVEPFYGQMEDWEVKEYKTAKKEHKASIQNKIAWAMECESEFNLMLSEYPTKLSVATFVAKYLQ